MFPQLLAASNFFWGPGLLQLGTVRRLHQNTSGFNAVMHACSWSEGIQALFFSASFCIFATSGKLPGTPFPPSLKVDGNGHFQPFLREQKWVHHPIETTMKKMDGHQVARWFGS